MSTEKKNIPFSRNVLYSGIAGAMATTTIYPLDISKTKLQDQKTMGKARTYFGPWDCLRKIISREGFHGIFRGWPPNVVLVMPEKAIKLSLNDFFRGMFKTPGQDLSLLAQMTAGGLAGFFQVSITNPMELLKIQGATMKDKVVRGELKEMIPYSRLIRNLGVSGLYCGVVATWMRDIPFSMLYFSLYAVSRNFSDSAFACGAIAGTVAAAVTTPVDVIKTRVHSSATPMKIEGPFIPGMRSFLNREVSLIRTQVDNLIKKEGHSAFLKGIVPRCLIISPLFAITMTFYEFGQVHFG